MTSNPLTSSVGGFPASPSASRENDSPKPTSGGSGPSSSASFAYYDPASCSWKTSQVSFLPECQTYSETWPRAGMTRNGIAYQRPQLVPRTCVTGSGLLPTPVAGMADRGDRGDLNTAVKGYKSKHTRMYPTPKSSPSGPDFARAGRDGSGGDDLATAIARMYPTPTVACATGGQTSRGGDRKDEPLLAGIVGGQLNPAFVEWLMGFPLAWSDLED
jgi:hypothetical protein